MHHNLIKEETKAQRSKVLTHGLGVEVAGSYEKPGLESQIGTILQ